MPGKKWNPCGKHCYVTGGSQGLGLALACRLARDGASVTVVARKVENLELAVQGLEANRQNKNQVFRYHSYPLNTSEGSSAALGAECAALVKQSGGHVTAPDAFFLCAGSSKPQYFVESTARELESAMEQAYWVQAWSAHAIFKKLVEQQRLGKIAFVGSTLSNMSFVGFSSYAPGKFALKGLAETLRSEGILYGIDVCIFFAPTMDSPGYAEEQKGKPVITQKFEEGDECLTCDAAATALLAGFENGQYHISATFLGKVFTNSARGASPLANPFLGPFYDIVSWVGIPFWRSDCDTKLRKYSEEHRRELEQKALIPATKD